MDWSLYNNCKSKLWSGPTVRAWSITVVLILPSATIYLVDAGGSCKEYYKALEDDDRVNDLSNVTRELNELYS